MENPDLILDGEGDVWRLDLDRSSCTDPWYEHSDYGYQRLSRLIKDYSPVRVLTPLDDPLVNNQPLPKGSQVELNYDGVLFGTVKSSVVHSDQSVTYTVEVEMAGEYLR